MAKNINSFNFTILLLVLLTASTGIQKSQAVDCGIKCINPFPVFHGECGPAPFTGTDTDCCACCKDKFGAPPVCKAVVEGSDAHCHCYANI